jgi:hypothetical protein
LLAPFKQVISGSFGAVCGFGAVVLTGAAFVWTLGAVTGILSGSDSPALFLFTTCKAPFLPAYFELIAISKLALFPLTCPKIGFAFVIPNSGA